MADVFEVVPFDDAKLFPPGLPLIHAVPATYRAGMQHFADCLAEVAAKLRETTEATPDNDAAVDALMKPADDAWFAFQRTLGHYRSLRDVKGWA